MAPKTPWKSKIVADKKSHRVDRRGCLRQGRVAAA